VVFYGWLASEVVVSMILPRLREFRGGVKPVKSDRGSGLVIITGILLAIIIAFTFSRQKIALFAGMDILSRHSIHDRRCLRKAVVHRGPRSGSSRCW
jgi:hypothetical protein